MTRRRFLLGLCRTTTSAVGGLSAILATRRPPAHAQGTTLT